MNPISVCVLLVAVAAVARAHPDWAAFKSTHGKQYDTPLEETLRKAIFLSNKQMIEEFNANKAEKAGFSLGLSHLSDKTREEIAARNGFRLPEPLESSMKALKFVNKPIMRSSSVVLPPIDWRDEHGVVSEVKDQGQCGSCWAFSATGALEAQMGKHNGTMYPLSEQNLIDCSKQNSGCEGGNMMYAWEDIHREGGLEAQADYPYEATDKDRECSFDVKKSVISDDGGALLTPNDESDLEEHLAYFGPVSAAIDASLDSFAHYKSGVYYDERCSSEKLNHAILVVGYGTDETHGDYWIVKNSWGKSWGDKGYIKMARNRNNHCGIASAAMVPAWHL